jgi:myo-inositol-1(or 4)-monophosphatase
MDINKLNGYKRFIRNLARESELIIMEHFRKPLDIQLKEDNTPVTAIDRMVEELMREQIIDQFPDHGIIGEEFGKYNPEADFQWVLDPIDGTKSFICGAVAFGTLIGLMYKNTPVLGALNLPALKQYLIGDGFTTLINGRLAMIRQCKSIQKAVLLSTDDHKIFENSTNSGFRNLLNSVSMYRFYGDCYGYYLLVSGFADIMYDPKMSPWDIIPLVPIIKGARGIITGHHGENPVYAKNSIASSRYIHPDLIDILSKSKAETNSA